jgi:hypothetical protein
MDPVATQLPPLLRQEGNPELQPVSGQSQWQGSRYLAPDSNRWSLQACMDLLVVLADDLQDEPSLEFAQGKHRSRPGIAPLLVRH